jgi:hypothetical protein
MFKTCENARLSWYLYVLMVSQQIIKARVKKVLKKNKKQLKGVGEKRAHFWKYFGSNMLTKPSNVGSGYHSQTQRLKIVSSQKKQGGLCKKQIIENK